MKMGDRRWWVLIALALRAGDHPESDYVGYIALLDSALEHLERGLPL
ncbi:MAG TPA: hypothetical protein VGZ32_21180 [Actinocrinis sp.]|jgi:hypothetical protein|nr:hypothetical protein [Actinocrinis sp.]HEV3172874.1 hypothetical protein [Actinocrinis sp.]